MHELRSNRASAIFRSMGDVEQAIAAARTLGMRDITVTTVYHPASESSRGDHIRESVEYYVDCAMLGDSAEFERQLAHIGDVRATLEKARSDKAVMDEAAIRDAVRTGFASERR